MNKTATLLHIKNNYNLIYKEKVNRRRRSQLQLQQFNEKVKEQNYKSTDINDSSIKRMKKAIDKLILISPPKKIFNPITNKLQPFRLNFITLTLPSKQNHSDTVITKNILSPFLKELQQKNKIGSYIWKAEKQNNGNIHFHITSNKFIHYQELRDFWNKHLEKLGYISDFQKKHNHRSPNSTDIHATKNIKNLEAYLVKYITKKSKDDNLKVTCKKWDCSRNLKRKEAPVMEIDTDISMTLDKIINNKKNTIIFKDYFTLIKNNQNIKRLLFKNDTIRKEFELFVKKIKATEKEYKKIKNIKIINNTKKSTTIEKIEKKGKKSYPIKIRYIQELHGYDIPRYKIVKDRLEYEKFVKWLNKKKWQWVVVNRQCESVGCANNKQYGNRWCDECFENYKSKLNS